MLRISESDTADGPVLVTIRPEAIELARNHFNSFPALVAKSRFGGVMTDCVATIGETRLRFAAPPQHRPATGDVATLHLPLRLFRYYRPHDRNETDVSGPTSSDWEPGRQ